MGIFATGPLVPFREIIAFLERHPDTMQINAASIAAVVVAVRPFAEAVVVDDRSSDGTGAAARSAGAHVITHPNRMGYDGARESGIRWGSDDGFAYAVTLDADGQHRAELIEQFCRELEARAKVVAGVQDRRRRFGETVFALVASLLWGIRDPLCGMNGYDLDVYRAAGAFDTYGSIGTELLLRTSRSGVSVVPITVPARDRVGTRRFGAGFRANLRVLRALLFGIALAGQFEASSDE